MIIENTPSAEQTVETWSTYCLQSYVGVEPTDEFWAIYGQNLDGIMAQTHKLDRGMRDISSELGVRVSDLEAFLVGKNILDIGCGTGRFAQDAARLKRTNVVALDHDEEALDKVTGRKNIEIVLGSGYDLEEAIGDREFDVVVSSFSSVLWARTEDQRVAALDGMFAKTAVSGASLIIPLLSNPSHRQELDRQMLRRADRMASLEDSEIAELNVDMMRLYTAGLMDMTSLHKIRQWTASGQADVAYRESRENRLGKAIQERYSAVVTKKAA